MGEYGRHVFPDGKETGGKLIHGYAYGAMNRLSRAWNNKGQETSYLYNGLGQRTGKSINGEEEDYLLDLTRGYHNLLGIQKEESGQRFYFDGNVAAMEETGGRTARGRTAGGRTRLAYGDAENRRTAFSSLHYYMQDELGSPLRVSGYRKKEGSFIGRSEYLTYGYDEFGNNLGNDLRSELEEAGIPDPYDRQGVEQPFGYTGYRLDDISGAYFAQAREYQQRNGRFTAEDVIKGNGAITLVLNQYSYCWNNPLLWADLNGLWPAWLEGIYAHLQFEVEFMIMYGNWDTDSVSKDIYGEVNVFLPGAGLKGGKGFADVILYNNDSAQIYEIKPESYHEDAVKRNSGQKQLLNYVYYYTMTRGKAYPGQEIYVEPLLYMEAPFIFDENRKIIYRMYADTPGMIYYDIVEKGKNETEEMHVMSKEEEQAYQLAWQAVKKSIWEHLEVIAGMIEDPESDNIFSSIFSPEAIIKSLFENILPFGGLGGNSIMCPI